MRVGFIGAGKMALSLTRGFLDKSAICNPSLIMASCPPADDYLLKPFQDLGVSTTTSNVELAENSDVVIIATKPNVVPQALSTIGRLLMDKLVISIAAGLSLKRLLDMLISCGSASETVVRLVRLMPNTACAIGEGVSVYTSSASVTQADQEQVNTLFSSVGQCHAVSEKMIDAVTAVSGSGPAYMYLIIEAMADGAVQQGLPRDLAYQLAAQTMIGAGRMVLSTGDHPAVLKDQVCSPAGTTIAALDSLEQNGVRSAFIRAIDTAADRCRELNRQ